MAFTRLRIGEGEEPQPLLQWDSVWQPQRGYADWALAGPTETQNRGGLQARAGLHTAVVLCLFTDKRIPDDHHLRHLVDDDPRGWFGDGIDLRADQGETEMGSLLWIFARAYLNDRLLQDVQTEAALALNPLIAQRAVVSMDIEATRPTDVNRCDLSVKLYGRDGSRVYDQRFEDLWSQTATSPKPQPFPPFPIR